MTVWYVVLAIATVIVLLVANGNLTFDYGFSITKVDEE